jgi:hypothetical protein
MSDSNEPKVTECWVPLDDSGHPDLGAGMWSIDPGGDVFKHIIAILAEDYDAMCLELQAHRARRIFYQARDGVIAERDATIDAMRKELEELRERERLRKESAARYVNSETYWKEFHSRKDTEPHDH